MLFLSYIHDNGHSFAIHVDLPKGRRCTVTSFVINQLANKIKFIYLIGLRLNFRVTKTVWPFGRHQQGYEHTIDIVSSTNMLVALRRLL